MAKRKTYGVNGLLEWHGIVESGNVKMRVSFTNGTVTAYGVAPATFVTTDKLTQLIIEGSKQYKNGLIHLVSSVELPVKINERKGVTENFGNDTNKNGGKNDTGNNGENIDTENKDENIDDKDNPVDSGDVQTVNVADKNEAVEWLKEHCDEKITAIKVRKVADFNDVCSKYGVKFVFTK